MAERKPPAVPQRPGCRGRHILKRAAAFVPGGGAARVGAFLAGRKIGRVAGDKVVLPAGRAGGAETAQVGAARLDVGGGGAVFPHGLRAQSACRRVHFNRRAPAAVAGVMPAQRNNAAAAAKVGGGLLRARRAEPGKQQRIAAKLRPRRGQYPGAVVKNFGAHCANSFAMVCGPAERRPRKRPPPRRRRYSIQKTGQTQGPGRPGIIRW